MNVTKKFRYVFPLGQYLVNKLQAVTQTCNYHKLVNCCSYQTCYFTKARFSSIVGSENVFEDPKEASNGGPENEVFDTNLITNGNLDLEKKLKILFLEVDILRQEGSHVPSSMKLSQWQELIKMNTRSMRKRYLNFLWKNEIKRSNYKKKKEEKRLEREKNLNINKTEEDSESHINYALHNNTIFLRVYDATITHFNNLRLINAMQFSQKLVVDCGYDYHMTSREAMNCAKQLMLLFSENRYHSNPFNLYLCNTNREGHTMKELQKFIPTLYDSHFPLNITDKSYLDLFPKEDIVYLTPHCREEMRTFDHDTVYIIGAIVDKVNKEPLSLAKAKQEGLKMAKLPLDRFLTWGSGSGKSLTLNQMIQILLELHSNGDWKRALQHVPRRKIEREYDYTLQCRKKNLKDEGRYRQRAVEKHEYRQN